MNGPEVRVGDQAFVKYKDGKVKFGYKEKVEVPGGPSLKMGGVKLQGKIAAKFCRKALW